MTASIMQRLRSETRAQHVATEAIPFSSAILDRSLPRSAYVGQLLAYLPVHRALEAAMTNTSHPALAAVWSDDMRRTPLLEADLDELGATGGEGLAARAEGESMAAWIADLGARDPIALLGVLYVMEGSSLGGAVLRRHLAAAYGLVDAGLRYYAPYGTHPKPHWVAFAARMEIAVTDRRAADRVVVAAGETFERIGRILAALTRPAEPLPAAV